MSMLKKLSLPLLLCALYGASMTFAHAEDVCPSLLEHGFKRLQDEVPQHLCQYAGNVILVVNTASYCGFTKQYEGLERLHAAYRDMKFTVLGFPSNDFGQQEPGDSKQIANLCFNTYGVKFPMFEKTSITVRPQNPFYAKLISASGQAPQWNFHKYLIDRSGKVVASFPSETRPDDMRLRSAIEKALAAQR